MRPPTLVHNLLGLVTTGLTLETSSHMTDATQRETAKGRNASFALEPGTSASRGDQHQQILASFRRM